MKIAMRMMIGIGIPRKKRSNDRMLHSSKDHKIARRLRAVSGRFSLDRLPAFPVAVNATAHDGPCYEQGPERVITNTYSSRCRPPKMAITLARNAPDSREMKSQMAAVAAALRACSAIARSFRSDAPSRLWLGTV